MLSSVLLLFACFLLRASRVVAAPTALDSATLLSNAQDAQALNSQFQTLMASDPCNAGQAGCIMGALAKCANGTWQTQKCASSQECLAMPSVSSNGTVVACTSEANALSVMNACGVQGLFASNSSTNGTTSSNSATSSPVDADAPSVTVTVTQTVSIALDTTSTLPSETRTLAPAAASSLLASLTASASGGDDDDDDMPCSTSSAGGTVVVAGSDADRAETVTQTPSIAATTGPAASTITLIPRPSN